MLSRACRRFRARFTPGAPGASAHRRRCADCAAHAAALERAAAARLPLPERLRAELSALSVTAGGLAPGRLPVPPLPLPGALQARLRAIARAGDRRRPPEWIASPRYALAASLLFTILCAALFGNPGELGARAVGSARRERIREMTREVASPLAAARETGEARLQALRATAVSRYTEVRGGVGASVQGLETRVSQIAGRLLPASPNENRPANRPRRTR